MKNAATVVIVSVHLTVTYRDNPKRNVFKHFSGCRPPSTFIVLLLDKEPVLESLSRRWGSSSAKER